MPSNKSYIEFTTGCVVNAISSLSGMYSVKEITDLANEAYFAVIKINLEPRAVGHILRQKLGFRVFRKRNGYNVIIN